MLFHNILKKDELRNNSKQINSGKKYLNSTKTKISN